jgi:ubiquitin-protein ligase
MNTVRERRLQSDFARLSSLASAYGTKLGIETVRGNPAETYFIACRGRSIAEVKNGEAIFCNKHHLKIELGAEYPAMPPLVTVLSPIFHPHVWPQNNVVCLGPWNITETLDNLVTRLYSIVAFGLDHMNWKSVANQEAAIWASRNQHLFPLEQLASKDSLLSSQTVQGWYESA